jgi:predicted MPP superfamily phosphohydrolase
VKGPFLYPRRYAPSREERPPRFERRVKVPLGWLLERLAAPFARWAPERLHTPEVVIAVRGLPAAFAGFRIAFVTDLHRGPCVPDAWLVHVAARTRELGPDVVALGGDFVSHARSELDGIERVLSQFTAPAGVVAVLGNHDCWVGAELVQRELERAGVRVLRNRSHVLERGGAALAIAGVDDFTHGAVRPDEALAAVPPGVPRVLLSHNPDLVEYLPDELRVDVMLAGHTHNGQVHLPVVGPFTVPSQFGSRYLHGLQRVRDTVLYVSAGVGACWVPFRWGNPPELTLVRLEAGG